jgi:hypothetical protein
MKGLEGYPLCYYKQIGYNKSNEYFMQFHPQCDSGYLQTTKPISITIKELK